MLILGIILAFLSGLLTINLIANAFTNDCHFSWTEQIGAAFPIGIGLQTLIMLVMDLIHLPLTRGSLITGAVTLCVILCIALFVKLMMQHPHLKPDNGPRVRQYNLVWLFFIGLIVYIEYMNFCKCIYIPTFDRDSLAGFDTIGYIIAQEHTFRGLSIFQADYIPDIHRAGSYIVYPPFVQLSYAFVYLLGAETSKIIPALMFLSFLFMFYGSLKRVIGATGAAIGTFFMLVTPEMIAFSSLSATNNIHAVFAASGMIYIALWLKYKEKKDLYLATLLLGLNLLCRTEGLVFILAALLVLGIHALKYKDWKNILIVALAFIPGLFWALYCKINGFYAESTTILHPFWDAEKAHTIWFYMKSHFTGTKYYGFTFVVLFFSTLLNIRNLIKKKDNWALLVMFVTAAVLYILILYHIEYKWDTIQNVLAFSAKRFLFCFVPIAWFIALSNQWMVWCWDKLTHFLGKE